jgi:hypothetical protein
MGVQREMSQVQYLKALEYDVNQLARALRRAVDEPSRAWLADNLESARERLDDAHRRIAGYQRTFADLGLTP